MKNDFGAWEEVKDDVQSLRVAIAGLAILFALALSVVVVVSMSQDRDIARARGLAEEAGKWREDVAMMIDARRHGDGMRDTRLDRLEGAVVELERRQPMQILCLEGSRVDALEKRMDAEEKAGKDRDWLFEDLSHVQHVTNQRVMDIQGRQTPAYPHHTGCCKLEWRHSSPPLTAPNTDLVYQIIEDDCMTITPTWTNISRIPGILGTVSTLEAPPGIVVTGGSTGVTITRVECDR